MAGVPKAAQPWRIRVLMSPLVLWPVSVKSSWSTAFNRNRISPRLLISHERLAAFCQEHGIRRLAIFGSALREDFGPDSDVDVLVEFEVARTPGLLGMARHVPPAV